MLLKIVLAMLAFAANSILCRFALAEHQIDPWSFSLVRICSGAFMLLLLWSFSQTRFAIQWHYSSALALAIYMAAFSYAYIKIDAGVGALLLFGTVQLSMVLYAVWNGEKLNYARGLGLLIALLGMLILLLPGARAPHFVSCVVMMLSGLAWATYSILGKNVVHPLSSSLGNFLLAVPIMLMGYLIFQQDSYLSVQGLVLAIISGAFTSSCAYVLWYSIVRHIDRINASVVQLSVPCLAIVGGALFMGEAISMRIMLSAVMVLLGIVVVIYTANSQLNSSLK